MGLLDVFTGASAKKAAAENSARLAQLQTTGSGYLDAGRGGALGSLESAKSAFAPLSGLGAKYGQGTDLYLDSLGVNGAGGNQRAVNQFQAGPGYQFGVNQSLDALDRRASSRGMLASGNNTIDTLGTVTGLANQEYGNWQNRLGGLIAPELSATGGAASGLAGLEAGKAPIWANDANARVGLASGVTTGLNSQATQKANAESAASGNVIKAGMGLAQLAMGMPPTSFSGIGGGGGGTGSLLGGGGNAPNYSYPFGGGW